MVRGALGLGGWQGPWVLHVTVAEHPPVGCLSFPLKKVDLDRDEWDWVLGPRLTPLSPWEPLGGGAADWSLRVSVAPGPVLPYESGSGRAPADTFRATILFS